VHGRDRIYRGVWPHLRFMALSFSVLQCSTCKSFNRPFAQIAARIISIRTTVHNRFLSSLHLLYLSRCAVNFDMSNIATWLSDENARTDRAPNYLQLIAWKSAATDLSQVKRRWNNNNEIIMINSFNIND